MKTLLLILSGCILTPLLMAQEPYLEINTHWNEYICYPPNTEFDIYDESGALIFTEKDLTVDSHIQLEGAHTIQLDVSWGDGQNTIEVNEAILKLRTPEKGRNITEKIAQSDEWSSEQPKVIKKGFIENPEGTYDLHLKFEGDIRFIYENGKAIISEQGEILPLLGKYVAKTKAGYLKMSYNPENKEYWFVFTDTYNKIIYK